MAGKHRESSASNTVAKVGALAGLAVTASLLSAGSASASPLTDALNHLGIKSGNAASSATTASNNVTVPLFGKLVNTGTFFTNPTTGGTSTPIVPGGTLITKPGPTTTPASGVTYLTTNGFRITGFCLNSKGCNS
jgi:hypothetical protein